MAGKDWWPGGGTSERRGGGRGGASTRRPGLATRDHPMSSSPQNALTVYVFTKNALLATQRRSCQQQVLRCNIWLWCERHFLPQIMGSLLKLSVNLQRASVALKAKVFNRCQNTILLLLKMQILNHNDCQSRILVGFGFS